VQHQRLAKIGAEGVGLFASARRRTLSHLSRSEKLVAFSVAARGDLVRRAARRAMNGKVERVISDEMVRRGR
jgi:hypothetical protein